MLSVVPGAAVHFRVATWNLESFDERGPLPIETRVGARDAGTTTPGSFHAPVVAEFELPVS
ncbi:MAG: hypothetical protein Q8S33_31605 [Myxococcales bacterium]|nr:hypothetical protein [Myxococcales bacterium]